MTSVPPIPGELWEQIPAEAQRALLVAFASYEARLAGLQEQLGQLQAQVAGLQQRLGQNSTNSSKPPSSDIVKPPKPVPPGVRKRKRGGQPGHARHQRPPFPAEQVDFVEFYRQGRDGEHKISDGAQVDMALAGGEHDLMPRAFGPIILY